MVLHKLANFGIGLYHSALEINGMEYCYDGNVEDFGTGVLRMTPMSFEAGMYKESFFMGVVQD